MSKICPLFSGSEGNSTYISSNSSALLIDAGASFKQLNTAIQNAGGNIEELKAVAVTHTHSDHIKGLKVLLKNTKIPIIGTLETLSQLIEAQYIPAGTNIICIDDDIQIGDMLIRSFSTSHDSQGSCGYTVTFSDEKKISLCTDSGIITDEIRNAISASDAVLLESNHDIDMLRRGPYPPHLKLRILSELGHLSNSACASELPALLKSGTTRFILGHLSRKNNLPTLARASAKAALMDIEAYENADYILNVAKPNQNEVIFL